METQKFSSDENYGVIIYQIYFVPSSIFVNIMSDVVIDPIWETV